MHVKERSAAGGAAETNKGCAWGNLSPNAKITLVTSEPWISEQDGILGETLRDPPYKYQRQTPSP